MKIIATLVCALSLSGMAFAAPISGDSQIGGDVFETAGHARNGVSAHNDCPPEPPPVDAIPEPASMALLGLGLAAAALRRRKS